MMFGEWWHMLKSHPNPKNVTCRASNPNGSPSRPGSQRRTDQGPPVGSWLKDAADANPSEKHSVDEFAVFYHGCFTMVLMFFWCFVDVLLMFFWCFVDVLLIFETHGSFESILVNLCSNSRSSCFESWEQEPTPPSLWQPSLRTEPVFPCRKSTGKTGRIWKNLLRTLGWLSSRPVVQVVSTTSARNLGNQSSEKKYTLLQEPSWQFCTWLEFCQKTLEWVTVHHTMFHVQFTKLKFELFENHHPWQKLRQNMWIMISPWRCFAFLDQASTSKAPQIQLSMWCHAQTYQNKNTNCMLMIMWWQWFHIFVTKRRNSAQAALRPSAAWSID